MGLAQKSDKIPRFLPSPLKQVLVILLPLFLVEYLLMNLLPLFAGSVNPLILSFVDAALLVTFATPFLWWGIVRPLRSMAISATLNADLLLNHIADGIISFDGAGCIKTLNPAAEQLFGYGSEGALGRPIGELLAIKSAGKERSFFVSLENGREEHSRVVCDAEGVRSDGSRFPAALTMSRVLLDGVWNFICIVRDVTESRDAEERLHQTNEKLDALIQASPQGIVTLDRGGNVTLWNRAAEEILGWSAEEVLGRPYPAVPEDLAIEHEKIRERILAGKRMTDVELRRRRKDGSPIDLSLSAAAIRDGAGTPFGIISIISDISARKRDERELMLLKRAIESSINGITITDATHPENPIIYVNPAFERITGYGTDEVVGKNPRFLRGDDRDQAELKKLSLAFREGREGCFVLRNYRRDRTPFWNELFIAPVRDRQGIVTNYIGIMNDITEHRRYEEQLLYQATHDPLTGLPNRNLLQDRLGQALALEAFRRRNPICVMFLDLDNFKKVNDTLGHTVGDMLLKAVANRLKNCLRGGDTVARLGGDEYIIILPNAQEMHDVITVAKKIINIFAAPLLLMGNEIYVTASIGIALFPTDGETVDALLKNADAAMYHAKEQGKNNYQFYSSEMNTRVFERLSLETSLHRAVKNKEFLLHYQPRVDLRTGQICGVEALVRWNHPEMGLVSPAKFIPLAEETGLIVPMGEWVLRTACAQNRAWQDAGFPPLRMAVNLSARQFRQENLIEMVEEILLETGLAPQWLELELTESLVMQEAEKSAAILRELTDRGIEVAIDDFGTGYSSLSYLKRFPIANLKIDQAFIRDMTRDPDDATLVKTIITMAHGLGMKTIAEGVELAEQIDFLCRHQCEEMQGYYFSRPVTAQELGRLLAEGKTLDLSPVHADARDRIRAV